MSGATQDTAYGLKVPELCSVFPDKNQLEVVNALKSSNGDMHIACAILLAETNKISETPEDSVEEQSNPLDELFAMFPNIDRIKIESIYQRTLSLDEAISELLSFPLLSTVDDQEQKTAETQIANKTPNEADESVDKVGIPEWKSHPSKIKLIRQYTAVSDSIARKALYKNSFHFIRAIIDLIYSGQYNDNTSEVDRTKAEDKEKRKMKQKRLKGGRVQTANGYAHSAHNSFDVLAGETATDRQRGERNRPYVYSDSSKEAKELQDILHSNIELRSISRTFLKRTLAFYCGDLGKTISLAQLIIEYDGVKDTYSSEKKIVDPTFKISSVISQGESGQPMRNLNQNKLNPQTFLNYEHYEVGRQMIDRIFTVSRLDFHGFVPKDAIQVLRICLEKWWDQELREREMKSQNLSIRKTLNMPPLEIVTGRGLHSVGGISTLKIKVRKFLDGGNYLYWEEPSYFIIEGKKSSVVLL